MHKNGICTVYVNSTGLKLEITSVYYRENIIFMHVHLWATQSMNQEFKFKTAQNSKNLRFLCRSS